jgi:predicted component of type VI protein secretion system
MFNKFENPAAREMRSLIHFFNAKNMNPAEIHRQLCDVYGEHATLKKLHRAIRNKRRGMLSREL